MSDMDYEKRNKEALERAKEIIECSKNSGSKEVRMVLSFFPELRENEDERIRKELLDIAKTLGKSEWIAWLEKKAEQKTTDKIEPKFKVGDFITNGILVGKIDEIHKWGYHAYFGDHYSDVPDIENWHKWTIQDAKDGDVVVDKSDGTIGIFQSIGSHPDGGCYNDPSYCLLHYHCDDEFFYADFENGNEIDSDDLVPATKEQRDLLFQKMHEAGYEWDAEKKELKKIEQNTAEWSEEDIETIERIVCILDGIRSYNTVDNKQEKPYQSEIDWLKTRFKFLRPRNRWKPSGEQIKLLEDICGYNTIVTKEEMGVLESLLEELKKLTE